MSNHYRLFADCYDGLYSVVVLSSTGTSGITLRGVAVAADV